MTGRVCPKHEEWCPTGECRWCAPEVPTSPPVEAITMPKLPPGVWLGWGATTPPPAALHYGNCPSVFKASDPCQCHLISAQRLGKLRCSCGAHPMRSIGDHYDEAARYFRHSALRCDARSAFYPSLP